MTALLHFPGGLTDEQYARFDGRGVSTNRVFYDWYRSEESSLAELIACREQAAFDTARADETIAHMEQRVTRTPLGVRFTLNPGDDSDALMLSANRMLYGDQFNPNAGYRYHNPVGGRGRWTENNGSYGRPRNG